MSKDYTVAQRLLALVDEVDAGRPLRLAEIQRRFNVTSSCAREYCAWVGAQRPLVATREGKTKVWRRAEAPDVRPEAAHRAAALAIAVTALEELKGTPHYTALVDASEQARLSVPDGTVQRVDRIARNVVVRRTERSRSEARELKLARLVEAIATCRVCRISYMTRERKAQNYDVEPWGLVHHGGRLYLNAGKRDGLKRPERRLFDVDAILKVSEPSKGVRFTEPAPRHTNFDKLFEHSWGVFVREDLKPEEVVLRVKGPRAVALQYRDVHPSQVVTVRADGSIEVRFRVAICDDVVGFVQGLLPHVEVIAPQALLERVRANVRSVGVSDRVESKRKGS